MWCQTLTAVANVGARSNCACQDPGLRQGPPQPPAELLSISEISTFQSATDPTPKQQQGLTFPHYLPLHNSKLNQNPTSSSHRPSSTCLPLLSTSFEMLITGSDAQMERAKLLASMWRLADCCSAFTSFTPNRALWSNQIADCKIKSFVDGKKLAFWCNSAIWIWIWG